MIVLFLEGKIKDYEGRFLREILAFNDLEIENTHNFIQWVFPLNEASKSLPGAPILFEEEIDDIRKSNLAKQNLIKSKDWFISFLGRVNTWETENNHNQKRVSRMIKSIRLLHSSKEADNCLSDVINLAKNRHLMSKNIINFWKNVN